MVTERKRVPNRFAVSARLYPLSLINPVFKPSHPGSTPSSLFVLYWVIAWVSPSPRSEEPRLNSSHQIISYAVFCLKKKKKKILTSLKGQVAKTKTTPEAPQSRQ